MGGGAHECDFWKFRALDSSVSLNRPSQSALPSSEVVEQVLDHGPQVRSCFGFAISAGTDAEFLQHRERVRSEAIHKLAAVLRRFGPVDLESLEASLGTRSPYTVLKRAGSMLAYFRWADKSEFDAMKLVIFSDEPVWGYLKFLKSSGAALTKPSAFLSQS